MRSFCSSNHTIHPSLMGAKSWMTYMLIYPKRWLIGAHCLVDQGSATTKCVLCSHVCARTTCARVCVPYHRKPFCWCFLLLILSLGSGYIKLLSGLPVWEKKKKVVSSASVHMYTAHSTRTVSVCVWDGDERKQSEGEGHRNTNIYRGRKERRKRQAARRKEHCVMLSGERRITLETRAQGKHGKQQHSTTIDAVSINACQENIQQPSTDHKWRLLR